MYCRILLTISCACLGVTPMHTVNSQQVNCLDARYVRLLKDGLRGWARPSVISMSYGWSEAKQCGGVTNAACRALKLTNAEYVNRTSFELSKVALLGTTMLASSGDSGCHGRTDKVCLFNPDMHPDFPAGSPYVTAVGGTQFNLQEPVDTANATTPICRKLTAGCAMAGTQIVSTPKTGSEVVLKG